VYDVGGRVVRTLASGPRDAGRYRAEWDGRDGTGARVAAGVYFVRLVAGDEAMTRKVAVMP
jgi:flagellar hook assembly protein FlgD